MAPDNYNSALRIADTAEAEGAPILARIAQVRATLAVADAILAAAESDTGSDVQAVARLRRVWYKTVGDEQ